MADGEIAKPHIYKTVGFPISSTRTDCFILCWSYNFDETQPEDHNIETMCILTECILEIEQL